MPACAYFRTPGRSYLSSGFSELSWICDEAHFNLTFDFRWEIIVCTVDFTYSATPRELLWLFKMHNQLLRGLIFVILVFLVTSDLKEIISTLATSSSISAFLQRQSSPAAQSSSHNQRSKRHASTTSGIHQTEVDGRGGVHGNEEEFMSTGSSISSLKLKPSSTSSSAIPGGDGDPEDSSNFNDYDSLHADRKINGKGAHSKKKIMKLNGNFKWHFYWQIIEIFCISGIFN